MIDVEKAVRDYLITRTTLTDLVSTRIYAGTETPPPTYTPGGTGPAIAFKTRGGGIDYTSAILSPSVQFKCYGADQVEANQVYRALYDALHEQQSATIKWAMLEGPGQTLLEPDTEWIFVLVFYTILVVNN